MLKRYCSTCESETKHVIDYECYIANEKSVITTYWVSCVTCSNINSEETKEMLIK